MNDKFELHSPWPEDKPVSRRPGGPTSEREVEAKDDIFPVEGIKIIQASMRPPSGLAPGPCFWWRLRWRCEIGGSCCQRGELGGRFTLRQARPAKTLGRRQGRASPRWPDGRTARSGRPSQ